MQVRTKWKSLAAQLFLPIYLGSRIAVALRHVADLASAVFVAEEAQVVRKLVNRAYANNYLHRGSVDLMSTRLPARPPSVRDFHNVVA